MTKADRTRQLIIEKTAPLFNRKGFAGTSLNDMTRATGLSKGSIYSNFKDKDDVALAVFDYNFRMLQNIILEHMHRTKTIRDRLLVYALVYDNFLHHPFLSAGCPIQNTATEADDTHPRLRVRAAEALVSWKTSLSRLVKKGIQAKEFRSTTNPDATAFTIIALIEGGILISKLTGKNRDQKMIRLVLEDFIERL